MVMWFYDEVGEMQDFQSLRQDVRRLEKEYLELRVLLRDTKTAHQKNPKNNYLQAKINYLKKRLKDLEGKAPRFSSDVPLEIALWGTPHG